MNKTVCQVSQAGNSINFLFSDGSSKQVTKSHKQYNFILKNLGKIFDGSLDVATIDGFFGMVENHRIADCGVYLEKGDFFFEGQKITSYLDDATMRLLEEGYTLDPVLKTLENICYNPNEECRKFVFSFLNTHKLPLTSDGCFLAYKEVGDDYKSLTAGEEDVTVSEDGKPDFVAKGRIPYVVGTTVKMKRSECDPNRQNLCSKGFHFGSAEYKYTGGRGKCLLLKINPRNVVSLPSDLSQLKGRTCEAFVMAEITKEEAHSNDPVKHWQKYVDVANFKSFAPTVIVSGKKAVGPLRDSKGRFVKQK